jgi:lambda repressor-like predicted transcriptional regulator
LPLVWSQGFSPLVEKTESHWLWLGGRDEKGVGVFPVGEPPRRMVKAHRWAWAQAHGPIPPGKMVLHRCGVRTCVNPADLYLGDRADLWTEERRQQHRVAALKARSGQRNLSEADVARIRARFAAGGVSVRALAAEAGLSISAMRAILGRRTWKQVE